MAFVLDCSVTMAWVFSDEASEQTDRLRESLVDDSAFVPALWPIETGNVLLMATRRGRIARNDWRRIRVALRALPINIDPVTTDRVWTAVIELAEANGISVYDAMYLELAQRLRLPLATLDRALAAAAQALRRRSAMESVILRTLPADRATPGHGECARCHSPSRAGPVLDRAGLLSVEDSRDSGGPTVPAGPNQPTPPESERALGRTPDRRRARHLERARD